MEFICPWSLFFLNSIFFFFSTVLLVQFPPLIQLQNWCFFCFCFFVQFFFLTKRKHYFLCLLWVTNVMCIKTVILLNVFFLGLSKLMYIRNDFKHLNFIHTGLKNWVALVFYSFLTLSLIYCGPIRSRSLYFCLVFCLVLYLTHCGLMGNSLCKILLKLYLS